MGDDLEGASTRSVERRGSSERLEPVGGVAAQTWKNSVMTSIVLSIAAVSMSRWVTMRFGFRIVTSTRCRSQCAAKASSRSGSQLREDHVGLNGIVIDVDAVDAGETVGKAPGVGVIGFEPLHVVVEGVYPRRRDEPDLAHPAADDLAPPTCLSDELPRAGEEGAGRGAKSLGQADRHAVELRGEFGGLDTERHCGVACARAVQVQGEAVAVAQVARGAHVLERQHLAGDRVLEAQQTGSSEVEVVRLDRGGDPIEVEGAVCFQLYRLGLNATQNRRAAALVAVVVGLLATDVLVAASAVGQQRKEVSLRTTGDQKRGLVTEPLRGHVFQPIDGRILAVDIVADLRLRHRGSHGRSGTGDGVASQVDELHGGLHGVAGTE